jgi:hypothetical protein
LMTRSGSGPVRAALVSNVAKPRQDPTAPTLEELGITDVALPE